MRRGGDKVVTITAKIQIFPKSENIAFLEDTYSAYNSACNWLSAIVFETKSLNQVNLNTLYYKDLRTRFSLKSQMAQSVMKTVIARYKSAKSNGHLWHKVRFKRPEYDLVWNRDYSLRDSFFSVNTLNGRIKVKYQAKGMKQYFDGTWSFGTAKLIKKFNKWFLHIPVTKQLSHCSPLGKPNIVGVDLGINFIATTYDNEGKTTFYSGKPIKQTRAHYKSLRKQLQMRQTPSARKCLKNIGQRENRYVSDVNHQITKALTSQYPSGTCFILEDLSGVRGVTEKVKLKNRYVSVSWSFYQFREYLEYKAKMNGQYIILVSAAYTSQTCPLCGHTEKANRNKKTHTFCCKSCSYESNDDRIGAMNLHHKGGEFLRTVAA
jgi:IS605 OrfB family transposase